MLQSDVLLRRELESLLDHLRATGDFGINDSILCNGAAKFQLLAQDIVAQREAYCVAKALNELPGAFERLGNKFCGADSLTRQYFSCPEPRLLKFQYETIVHLTEGKDCLLLMPTGAGKSLPAVLHAAATWDEAYRGGSVRLPATMWMVPTVALCVDIASNLNRRFQRFQGWGGRFALALDGSATPPADVCMSESDDATDVHLGISWDRKKALSMVARERIIFELIIDGSLHLAPAGRQRMGYYAEVPVNEHGLVGCQRRLKSRWRYFDFAPDEAPPIHSQS